MEACLEDYLKKNNNHIITYYEVDGTKVNKKLAKVVFYKDGHGFHLINVDKLGRMHNYYKCINATQFNKYGWTYYGTYCFILKEKAYDFIISKLRSKRQEINKKMMEVLKEASKDER